jgi:hypothetical protein
LRGRKPVPVDLEQLEKLAAMHCTHAEVAAWFSRPGATISQQAISRKFQREPFKSTWAIGWAKGSISLRRKQKQMADDGDKTMLIWLGKQWLGQSDRQAVEVSGREGGAIQHEHDYSKLSDAELEDAIVKEAEGIARRAAAETDTMGPASADEQTG